jgi:hypothetical protein
MLYIGTVFVCAYTYATCDIDNSRYVEQMAPIKYATEQECVNGVYDRLLDIVSDKVLRRFGIENNELYKYHIDCDLVGEPI